MATEVLGRSSFQQYADLVCGRAEVKGWPSLTYQAGFITVGHPGSNERTLEGNSAYWKAAWDSGTDGADHSIIIAAGEQAWRTFLGGALYPDLLRADKELQRQ